MSLTGRLRELVTLLTDLGSPIRGQLRPGITERVLGHKMSPLHPCPDLVESYAFANGQTESSDRLAVRADLLPHLYPMSIDEAMESRASHLAVAGLLHLQELDLPVFELDCLPVLGSSTGDRTLSMGQGAPGNVPGRISTPRHTEPFGEVEPNLLTMVERTITALGTGELVVDPWGSIWETEYAPKERHAVVEIMFTDGTLHGLVSSSSEWLGTALTDMVELVEACGSVVVKGSAQDSVKGNHGRELDQIAELVRLLALFGVPADWITTEVVQPTHECSAHLVDIRVTFPRPSVDVTA